MSLGFFLGSNLMLKWNRNLLDSTHIALDALDMTLSPTQIPPYVSHRTFTTFLESLRKGIPDRIDGSVFDASFSGASRKQITSALKSLNLVDAELRPTARLSDLVMSTGEQRKATWREMLQEIYEPVFALDLETATPFQLKEELRKIVRTESMLTKCESFFKYAAADAGIRLSPHIMRRKLGPRRRKAEPRAPKPEADTTAAPSPASATTLGSTAEGVWRLFPQFDPKWSDKERENWVDSVERITKAQVSMVDSTNSNVTRVDEEST